MQPASLSNTLSNASPIRERMRENMVDAVTVNANPRDDEFPGSGLEWMPRMAEEKVRSTTELRVKGVKGW